MAEIELTVSPGSDDSKPTSLFSPTVDEFKPRSPCSIVFPAPEPESPTSSLVSAPQGWSFTPDGHLVDKSGATWELADEILRLQAPFQDGPIKEPPTCYARRFEEPPAPYGPYCSGKLGEPHESFPFTAFSTWRQKGLVEGLPSPPTALGYGVRRRAASVGSEASVNSAVSVSYMAGVNGFTGAVFDSPRSAFANFEAIHSRRSSVSIPGSAHPAWTQSFSHEQAARSGSGGPSLTAQYQQTQTVIVQESLVVSETAAADTAVLAPSFSMANQRLVEAELSQAMMRVAALQASGPYEEPIGPSPQNRRLDLYKTELCRGWETQGCCRYGAKCQFAHGVDDLRPHPFRRDRFKGDICRIFRDTGFCHYGNRCIFTHAARSGGGSESDHSGSSIPATPLSARSDASDSSDMPMSSSSGISSTYLGVPGSAAMIHAIPAAFKASAGRRSDSAGGLRDRFRSASQNDLVSKETFGGAKGLGITIMRSKSPTMEVPSRLERLRSTSAQPLPPPRPRQFLSSLHDDDPWPTDGWSRNLSLRECSSVPSLWAPCDTVGVDIGSCRRASTSA